MVNIVVKKTSRYPRVIFLGDFEFKGSSAARLGHISKVSNYICFHSLDFQFFVLDPIEYNEFSP